MAKTLLEMKNIVKLFPGVRALDNVNLKVEEGEVHALVGENGAGKSTLMNVLSGIYPYGSYEGDILYNGEVCQFKTIKDSEAKGIVIIHQELALVPYLSIGENMFLGNERGSKARIDWDETYHRADELLRQVGLTESSRVFRALAGTAVELYTTTLHYAPCDSAKGAGFRVAVVLPRGTNTEKPDGTGALHEDKLLWARNKWLIAHPDTNEAKQGAFVGLEGENPDIAPLI